MTATGKLLKSYSREGIPSLDSPVQLDQNFDVLGTYSWAQCEADLVNVPGKFAQLRDIMLQRPIAYENDIFLDENCSRSTPDPFRPLFSALIQQGSPGPDFGAADVLADTAALCHILTFFTQATNVPIRLDLELVGSTLVLRRRAHGLVRSVNGKGFRSARRVDAFRRMATTREHRPGEGDNYWPGTGYRVLRYRLGSLSCVARHAVQASLTAPATFERTGIFAPAPDVAPAEPSVVAPAHTPLALFAQGAASADRAPAPAARLALVAQSYFARLPHVVASTWRGKVVTGIQLGDLGERFGAWERAHQAALRQLGGLLRDLRARVARLPGARAALVYRPEDASLKLWEREDVDPAERIEDGVLDRFWGDRETWDPEIVALRDQALAGRAGGTEQGLEPRDGRESGPDGERGSSSNDGEPMSSWTKGARSSRAFQ